MEHGQAIEAICAFLDRIGISYRMGSVPGDTFLPGLEISAGGLTIDPERLSYPGDILHEAGHIALTPTSERANLDQDALGAQSPKESEEIGVLLWTYLAAKDIGLPPDVVFHAGGYKKGSNWLIEQFESGTYIGLPLLVWMGIAEESAAGLPGVRQWLRD
jgi:hypothetical protein